MERLVLLVQARVFIEVVENALTAAGAAIVASFSAVENFMLLCLVCLRVNFSSMNMMI
jgi:hypothetical protein